MQILIKSITQLHIISDSEPAVTSFPGALYYQKQLVFRYEDTNNDFHFLKS